MKRLLLIAGCLGILSATKADAYDFEQDGIYYNLGSSTENVLTVTQSPAGSQYSGNVAIPEKVTIGNLEYTVTAIGEGAFTDCSDLTSVTMPNTVTSIGRQAFTMCMGLESVTFPASLRSIGDYAFLYCIQLTSAKLPESLVNLGTGAFSTCMSLSSVTLSGNLTELPDNTFIDCSELREIAIPASVKRIGQEAFSNCSELASVTLSDALESIGNKAFYNCYKLGTLVIPKNTVEIAIDAFRGCKGLQSIDVEEGSSAFSATDGVLYDSDKTTLIMCPAGKTSVEIAGTVTAINDYAFTDGTLTSVRLPDGVTSIGSYAFNYCTGLVSVSIPETVVSIGEFAFAYCIGLESAALPAGVKTIPYGAFYYCTNLSSYEIPSGITNIGREAFAYCSNLREMAIPASVTSIGTYAFHYCTNLTTVSIPASVTMIGDYAFAICPMIESFKVLNREPITCMPGFTNDVLANATLYVPQSSIEAYMQTSPWNEFRNIHGLDLPEPDRHELVPEITPADKSSIQISDFDNIVFVFPEGTKMTNGNASASLECAEAGYRETADFRQDGTADGTFMLSFAVKPQNDGTYTLTVAEDSFVNADGNNYNPVITCSWEIKDTPEPDRHELVPEITPADKSFIQISDFDNIVFVFPEGTKMTNGNASASLECAEAGYRETADFRQDGTADGTFMLSFAVKPQNDGTYTLTVAEDSFVNADGNNYNPVITCSWEIRDTGADTILAGKTTPTGVYDLRGTYMGKSLESLPAGIYLVKGRKIAVSGR